MQPASPAGVWFAAVSAHLQRRWPTIDPQRLDDLAVDLSRDPVLRNLPPEKAAEVWLQPISRVVDWPSDA